MSDVCITFVKTYDLFIPDLVLQTSSFFSWICCRKPNSFCTSNVLSSPKVSEPFFQVFGFPCLSVSLSSTVDKIKKGILHGPMEEKLSHWKANPPKPCQGTRKDQVENKRGLFIRLREWRPSLGRILRRNHSHLLGDILNRGTKKGERKWERKRREKEKMQYPHSSSGKRPEQPDINCSTKVFTLMCVRCLQSGGTLPKEAYNDQSFSRNSLSGHWVRRRVASFSIAKVTYLPTFTLDLCTKAGLIRFFLDKLSSTCLSFKWFPFSSFASWLPQKTLFTCFQLKRAASFPNPWTVMDDDGLWQKRFTHAWLPPSHPSQ